MTDVSDTVFIVNLAVAAVFIGMLFCIYGACVGMPSASLAMRSMQGFLIGGSGRSDFTAVTVASGEGDAAFVSGCLLIIGGACIDVWRRMRMVGR